METLEEFEKRLALERKQRDDIRQKENAKFWARMAKLDEDIFGISQRMNSVGKQIGGINENIGCHAEQYFQEAFAKNKTFGGVKYKDIVYNMSHNEKSGGVEFDIALINGSSIALIEVKNRIHPKFVEELATDRVEKFKKYFPRYAKRKVYLGIAAFSFGKVVLEEAKKHGIGIIRQVGKGVEIDTGKLKAY